MKEQLNKGRKNSQKKNKKRKRKHNDLFLFPRSLSSTSSTYVALHWMTYETADMYRCTC
jgi:hypothetical protein